MEKKSGRVFEPGAYHLRVGRSRTGLGLFAGADIPRGACIIEYVGRRATKKEMREDRGKYLFWTSRTSMIDGNVPRNTARYINHSCAPNCEVRVRVRRIYIFSKRRIRTGEELNYDYDTEYFEKHIKPKGCRCTKCLKAKETSTA